MRKARLKIPGDREVGYYHCISRVVHRQMLLGTAEKEKFVQIMREYEEFCEVKVLTFCVMANHFHILVEIPKRPAKPPSAEDLLKKLERLTCQIGYQWVRQRLEMLQGEENSQARQEFLESFYVRMWDVSWFIRLVKQRFSAWFNKRTGRKGTLWEERFKSVLVDGAGDALVTMAAYIDLNPVRAGVVKDPARYRWTGYAEATAGRKRARNGVLVLASVLANSNELAASKAMEFYRTHLYLEGDERRAGLDEQGRVNRGSLKTEDVESTLRAKGRIPVREYVRRRVRYFCDGAIFGSREFVDEMFRAMKDRLGQERDDGARRMRGVKEELFCFRDLRVNLFGKVG